MTFPIGISQRNEVADGVHMETIVTLQSNGLLSGTTHTWTRNNFQGAHAVASVIIFDANKQPIWVLEPIKCGVAGRWDPSGSSNRYKSINVQVPEEAMRQVASISVVNTREDYSIFGQWVTSHLDDILRTAVSVYAAA